MPEFQRAIVDARIGVTLRDGQLFKVSPKGKILQPVSQAELLSLVRGSVQNSSPVDSEGFQSLTASLALQGEVVNREQFGTVLGISGAAMKIVSEFNPDFKNLTLEEKFQQLLFVIDKIGEAAVSFEKYRLQISELDLRQNVLQAAGELMTRGFWDKATSLPSKDKELLFNALQQIMGLTLTSAAAQLPEDVIERGNRNLIALANASANISQATERARIETERSKITKDEAENLKNHNKKLQEIEQENTRKKNEAAAEILKNDKAEELAKIKAENRIQLNKDAWGSFTTGVKRIPSDTINGLVNIVFDPNDGVFIRVSRSFTAVVDHLSENTATTRIIGFGAGGGVGLAAGVLGATWLVTAVEGAAAVTSTIGNATIWGGGGLIGLSGAAAGAYLGPNIVLGVRNTYEFFRNVAKDSLAAVDTWVRDPKRRWNKP